MIISKAVQCSAISEDFIKFRKSLIQFIMGNLFKSTTVFMEPESPVHPEGELTERMQSHPYRAWMSALGTWEKTVINVLQSINICSTIHLLLLTIF